MDAPGELPSSKTYVRGRFVVTEGKAPEAALPVLSEACSYHSASGGEAGSHSSLRKSVRAGRFHVRWSEEVEVNLLTRSHSFHSYEKLKDTSSEPSSARTSSDGGAGTPRAAPQQPPAGAGLKRSRSLPANCARAAAAAAAAAAGRAAGARAARAALAPSPFTSPQSAQLLAAGLQAAAAAAAASAGGGARMYQRGRFTVQEAGAAGGLQGAAGAVLAAAAEVLAAAEQQLQTCGSASSVSSAGSCASVVSVVKRGRFLVHTTSLDVASL
jgi:hypothetical protein